MAEYKLNIEHGTPWLRRVLMASSHASWFILTLESLSLKLVRSACQTQMDVSTAKELRPEVHAGHNALFCFFLSMSAEIVQTIRVEDQMDSCICCTGRGPDLGHMRSESQTLSRGRGGGSG